MAFLLGFRLVSMSQLTSLIHLTTRWLVYFKLMVDMLFLLAQLEVLGTEPRLEMALLLLKG